ncbi:hypothetical protein ACFLV0_01320, partial [Chloroflexota bacterium]
SATIHGHVRTLRAFSNWLVSEELAQNNPAKDLKPPKVSRKVVSTLSDEEIGIILSTFSISPSESQLLTHSYLTPEPDVRWRLLLHLWEYLAHR